MRHLYAIVPDEAGHFGRVTIWQLPLTTVLDNQALYG